MSQNTKAFALSSALRRISVPSAPTAWPARKRLALVAHDLQKPAIVAWTKLHRDILEKCELWATGTTGELIARETGLAINLLKSGPLGGDQQLGAMIVEGRLDILIFFTDSLTAMPHDVDVKALLRISTLSQTVLACNRATADVVITSPLFDQPHGLRDDGDIQLKSRADLHIGLG